MFLRNLKISNFKNIENSEFDFLQLNCFVGNNGVGKTNVLDAIYYLSFCKSFFNHNDFHSIRYGADFFALHGDYLIKGEQEKISCTLKDKGKKQIKHSGKLYTRHSEHIGKIPAVMIAPNDHVLITGGSDVRRKFVDQIISQQDRLYLQNLIRYNKAIEQRNRLLKAFQIYHCVDEMNYKYGKSKLRFMEVLFKRKERLFLRVFFNL
jgi:DNA replication and repair protein RecF